MFLGIEYNKWHGILAVIAVFLAFVFFDLIMGGILRTAVGPAAAFLLLMALGILSALFLHNWNEAHQAIDPKLLDKYGSLARFQSDSRDDWKWFWRGILISWLLPIVYWRIIL